MRQNTKGGSPISCRSTVAQKASLDALVARALWEHLAKSNGECPSGMLMQPTLDVSSDSAGSSKGIDAEVRRAEADKERVVCEMGKEVNLTFERKSVDGEPQYNEKYLEWISSQKWKSYDTYDSRSRQVRVKIHPTHMGQEDTVECPLPEDNLPSRTIWTMDSM